MKINDINESKQINELDLSSFIGDRGAAGVRSGLASLAGDASGNQSTEDRMAMDIFLKKFIGNASQAVNQAVKSGLVAQGATAPATAAQTPATAGTSAPASQSQAIPQSPEQIRKQKQAIAAKTAQDQMSANPVVAKAAPAVAPTPAQIRQQKQASAAQAAQSQMAPVSKLPANQPAVQAQNIRQQKQAAAISKLNAPKSAPVSKAPPGFNAQNVMKMPGMKKQPAKKVPAMAESMRFDRLNTLFESIIQEATQQSISQYLMGFFKKFMTNVDPKALQAAMPKAEALAKEAEASYPKMNVPLTKMAQLGWAVSHQQGEDEPQQSASGPAPATPPAQPATAQASNTQQVQTVYSQVKGMLDKLDKKGKQRILTALQKSLGSSPATPSVASAPKAKPASKPTNEPMTIGGQKISPNDPLYAKMQQKLAGK